MNPFWKSVFLAVLLSAGLTFWGTTYAAAAASPPLVTPAWLHAHLHARNLVVIEVYDRDNQRTEFEQAHVPSAVFTGFLDDGWRHSRGDVPDMLPPKHVIAKVIGQFGISNASRVILVPGGAKSGDIMATTRIYWTLRIEGQSHVSILNGGDHAWQAEAADPVARGPASPHHAVFVPHWEHGMLATLAMVRKDLKSHKSQLVDARSVAQVMGEVKSPVVLKAGTLPGAISLPYSELVTADHEGIRNRHELLVAMHKAHIALNRAAISFCNTGHLGAADWFVLREVLGNRRVTLYDGSMTQWTRHHPALPVVPGTSAFQSVHS